MTKWNSNYDILMICTKKNILKNVCITIYYYGYTKIREEN